MHWVLFFDGDCAFCSKSVRTVARLDKAERVSFAPLQGKLAGELGFSGHAAKKGGTMVLLRERDGRVFKKSDAWIELARALGGWFRLLSLSRFVPRVIRDRVYDWVADNRYRFLGENDTCALPDPGLMARLRD